MAPKVQIGMPVPPPQPAAALEQLEIQLSERMLQLELRLDHIENSMVLVKPTPLLPTPLPEAKAPDKEAAPAMAEPVEPPHDAPHVDLSSTPDAPPTPTKRAKDKMNQCLVPPPKKVKLQPTPKTRVVVKAIVVKPPAWRKKEKDLVEPEKRHAKKEVYEDVRVEPESNGDTGIFA